MGTHPPRTRHTLLVGLAALLLVAAGCEAAPPPGTSHSPSGNLEAAGVETDPFLSASLCSERGAPSNCTLVRVRGWAWDWDWAFPIPVVSAVLQEGRPLRWDYRPVLPDPRPDVQAAYGRGFFSGFTEYVVVDHLPVTVCAVAINQGPGDHTILGCRTVRAT